MTAPVASSLLAVRPRLRGVSHALAAAGSVPIGIWLIPRAPTAGGRWATAVYALCMTAMFTASAGYHLGRWSGRSRRRMKAADHVAIFFFIAASYGPLAVHGLSGRAGTIWLCALWIGALLGSVVKVRTLDRSGGPADLLYGILSGSAILLLPALVTRLDGVEIGLLLGGLLFYGASSYTLISRRPDPWPTTFGYHEWAHLCVVGGVLSHVVCYAMLFR